MPTYAKYALVRNDAELKALAAEMKANALAHPMDPQDVAESIMNEPGQKERVGPMVRVHGPNGGEFTKKYSRFITFSLQDVHPLQVTYFEYGTGDKAGMVKQLTISNNSAKPLRPQDITRIAHFFLDTKKITAPIKTPAHVALLFNYDERLFDEKT